jgi:HAD-superfamily hydrolase, subfamily IIB
MTYKMLVSDIDDTLMNDEGTISEGNREALAAAAAKGVIVTLATGRMYASAKNVAAGLGLNVPLITYQGSLIKNLQDGRVLYERWVPEQVARELFRYAEDNGVHIQAYADDTLFAKEDNDKVKAYAAMSDVPYEIEPDFDRLLSRRLTKILFYEDPERLDQIMAEVGPSISGKAHMTKSKPYFLEFLHPEATKGQAILHLARHFGILPEEVIAVGDSWNDRDMLEIAGLGVAVANAVDALKAAADYVSPYDNNQDGVKHVVEKFILR